MIDPAAIHDTSKTPTEEIGMGSPGTGPGGKSLRSPGMNFNTFDAAEVALGLRKNFRFSPDHGGYTFLQSVEFDVPADTGNMGTRADRFNADEMVGDTGVSSPRHGDYTNSGFDRGHGAAQELSGGDVDVAAALRTMTNVWPQDPHSNQHGDYRGAENAYKALKQQNPDSWVRIRVSATYGNPPRLIAGGAGRQTAVPESFTVTAVIEHPDGSVVQQVIANMPN